MGRERDGEKQVPQEEKGGCLESGELESDFGMPWEVGKAVHAMGDGVMWAQGFDEGQQVAAGLSLKPHELADRAAQGTCGGVAYGAGR
jgi:hypothetical protein